MVEQPACEPVPPSAHGEQDSQVWLRHVQPGESAALVTAYQDAVTIARCVRTALDRLGISETDAVVVASLTDTGRPVARLILTPTGHRRLGSRRPDYPLTA